MTIPEFKLYCERKQYEIIIYNDENDRDYNSNSANTYYFNTPRFVLSFDSVSILYHNPTIIVFKGDCGIMSISNIQNISIRGDCPLGDIIIITAIDNNMQRNFVFIGR